MILTIDKYKFECPYFEEDKKLLSRFGGKLRSIPINKSSSDWVVRFSETITDKMLSLYGGPSPKIDKEFTTDKYKHGLAFIKVDGLLSDGRKVIGLWPSKIEKLDKSGYLIYFEIDEINSTQ